MVSSTTTSSGGGRGDATSDVDLLAQFNNELSPNLDCKFWA
jgi:hypothetical protein